MLTRILITGSSGFLGSNLMEALKVAGHEPVPLPSMICDLRNLEESTTIFRAVKPDVLVHAAAVVGGVSYNLSHHADIFYTNTLIGLQTLEAARIARIKRVISISSACAYPATGAMTEERLWLGEPDGSVLGYGVAKRLQELQGRLYRDQYGMEVQTLILSNLYGPFDHFGERAHVIPALIRRFLEAREARAPEVKVWGSGIATRDMLYVEDAAEAVVRFIKADYTDCLPLNIGTGRAVSVTEIARTIQDATGYPGTVVFDLQMPEGQSQKTLDITRMKEVLKWVPPTGLAEGIKQTIEWYMKRPSLVIS